MDIVIFTLGGVLGLMALNIIFNKLVKLSVAQSAVLSSLISMAILIPYSLANWQGGDVFALYFSCFLLTSYAYYSIGKTGIRGMIDPKTQRFHWVPITILLFFVGLIIVDGAFVVIAQKGFEYTDAKGRSHVARFNGEVVNAYQKKEAYFNEYQDRIKAQIERGWQIKYGFEATPKPLETTKFMVQIKDKFGQPLNVDSVAATFIRAADRRLDRQLMLTLEENGQYSGDVIFEKPGAWELWMVIRKGKEEHEIRADTYINALSKVTAFHN